LRSGPQCVLGGKGQSGMLASSAPLNPNEPKARLFWVLLWLAAPLRRAPCFCVARASRHSRFHLPPHPCSPPRHSSCAFRAAVSSASGKRERRSGIMGRLFPIKHEARSARIQAGRAEPSGWIFMKMAKRTFCEGTRARQRYTDASGAPAGVWHVQLPPTSTF
jgi:hypothetical protein